MEGAMMNHCNPFNVKKYFLNFIMRKNRMKNKRIILSGLFLWLFAIHVAISAPNHLIFVPGKLYQDFEEGHISGWESYPPFQDSAFDPEFKCSRDDNLPGSQYALMRRIKVGFPTEYEFGFIRKFSLYVESNSSLSLDYLLRTYGDGVKFEVVLCGKDGKRYSYVVTDIQDDMWRHLQVPLSSFKHGEEPLSVGQELEAIYVLVYLRRTNPDVWYRIYIDNVVITGERPAKFIIDEPSSSWLEHWNKTVLHKHYSWGDALSLKVMTPAEIQLTSVTFTLKDPAGKERLTQIPLNKKENKYWYHDNIYHFSENDPFGKWYGILYGMDHLGRQIKTEFDIWLTEKSQPHPRLYFSADKIDYYKSRIKEAHWQVWWDSLVARNERLRKTANLGSIPIGVETTSIPVVPGTRWSLESLAQVNVSIYDTTYLLPTLRHYFKIMVPAMNILQENALVYAITGDTEVGDYVRQALVTIAGWDTWTHPWFVKRHQESYYPVGELGVRAAFCYDLIYHLLSEEERRKVQEGLLRNCIIPVYKEYVVENRIPSGTSNWIGNSVSGALSCALAIYGDNPEMGDLEPYISGLIAKLENHIQSTLDPAGAWGEGIGYQGFAYSNVLPTLTALQNVLNFDLTTEGLWRSYLYFLYNYAEPEILDMGDSAPKLYNLSFFAWLSQRDDPVFRWFYNQSPREHFLDFIFGQEKGKMKPPTELPTSIYFPELGSVVFRSGWRPDDIVFNFRCGPHYNHQHFDDGNFLLSAFGELLVPEAGKAHYYDDPWYRLYYIQPVGHNTVLVDRNPGSQISGDYRHFVRAANNWGEITEFVGTDFYGAVTSEMHKLYRGKLKLFERNILFIQPEYFVVFDRLRSSGQPHEYDWLLHCQNRPDVVINRKDIFFHGNKASLLAKVIAPKNARVELKGAPVKLEVPITFPGYLQVSNPEKSPGENFLVVLFPHRDKAFLEKLVSKIRRLEGENFVGVEIERLPRRDELYFKIQDNQSPIKSHKLESDGRIVSLITTEGRLERVATHQATHLQFNGIRRISGSHPFTAAGEISEKRQKWVVQTKQEDTIFLFSPRKPVQVKLNEIPVQTFEYDTGNQLLQISLKAGRNLIEVNF